MLTPAMLSGQSRDHLITLEGHHQLQPEAVSAFRALQQAARQAGFNLQPVSTFRDFERQLAIWNDKYTGQRPVLDPQSQPIDVTTLSEMARCQAILRWSALPGASRHHWGSDVDVYDPDLLSAGQSLQLITQEYLKGGELYPLTQWLSANMAQFGFYRPYNGNPKHWVAMEPWHLSYRPLATPAARAMTPQLVRQAWQHYHIGGQTWLMAHLDTLLPATLALEEPDMPS